MFAMGRLLALATVVLFASGAGADTIHMYTKGEESLAAHLKAMAGARRSIDIMTYEFKPCEPTTKLVIGVLTKKASEGVRVRVIVDDFPLTKNEKRGLAGYFASLGIEFKVYNDSFFLGQNHRSHIKLTLIDGDTASPTYFADSSNYADSYWGMNASKNYVNRDFKIVGRSGAQVREAFEMLWSSRPSDPVSRGNAGLLAGCLADTNRDAQVRRFFNNRATALAAAAPSVTCSNITYQADDPDFQSQRWTTPGGGDDRRDEEYMNIHRMRKKVATKGFLEFVSGTRRVLNIENQYYIPVYRMRTAIDELREDKGVKILVLTNLTAEGIDESSSRALSYFISKAARRDSEGEQAVLTLPSRGQSLRAANALTPGDGGSWHMHSKSMVRDHKDVWFGSYNIDPRSYHTNLENAVVVKNCPALAKLVEDDYKRMVRAYEVDLKNCRGCRGESVRLNPFEAIGAMFKHNFL